MKTSYYQNKKLNPKKHMVVQTSNSRPRFGAQPEWDSDMLMPPIPLVRAAHHGLSQAEFTRQYLAHLERVGLPTIRAQMDRLAELAGAREVVLCCFEALNKPGQYCHRRIFAEWWQDKTGETIAEF
jgi:hypothetical protein